MTTTLDLIKSIVSSEPVESERMFQELMADRIAAAIEDKKQEVASTMFASREELEASIDEDQGEEVSNEAE